MDDEGEKYCCLNDFINCKEFYKNNSVKENPLECASFISFWCIVFGISLVILAFAIPRDYAFDTTIPAREMESIEQYYRQFGLYTGYTQHNWDGICNIRWSIDG